MLSTNQPGAPLNQRCAPAPSPTTRHFDRSHSWLFANGKADKSAFALGAILALAAPFAAHAQDAPSRTVKAPQTTVPSTVVSPSKTAKTTGNSPSEAAKSEAPKLPVPQPNVIVLDAAHGGDDTGARIGNSPEKDVNQQIATRLRSLLQARSFDVKYLREADAALTPDQRAGQANQARATACIVIHSASTGEGVRIYTSALANQQPSADGPLLIRWNRAQAPYIDQSRRLADRITQALTRSRTSAAIGRTFTVPIDSMQCPAVLIEVGPTGQGKTMPTDTIYQQQIAEAIAGTLMQWRDEAKAVVKP